MKIALAGNPNVGKSTVFNYLTGLKQHTGNWAGKTVENTSGVCNYKNNEYIIYDLPGTYSLIAHSKEEELARDFICFEQYDAVIVVCDAVCLERNLNLVLQILEVTNKVIVCVNLLDEAKKKKIEIDIKKLEQILKVPVVGTSARSGIGMDELMEKVSQNKFPREQLKVKYEDDIEQSIEIISSLIEEKNNINSRFTSLRLLDESISAEKLNVNNKELIKNRIKDLKKYLVEKNIKIDESIATSIAKKSEQICKEVITFKNKNYNKFDRKIDKILTNKITCFPIIFIFLIIIFWITIVGSNYPSSKLFELLFSFEQPLLNFLEFLRLPTFIIEMFVYGIYRVLAWVVSVMLPPMAIFFPLFTLLEDLGFLPRIAFNIDKIFNKCKTCGKQALTMCMSFGCNAVGVTGARIIDSKRERLIAILTNNFIPCNGRFPAIITIISIFLIGSASSGAASILSSIVLALVIMLGIGMTFLISNILSKTILKGVPSSFTLELPPYRKPQIGKVIVRSILDRTLFVLGRAILIAVPAGLIIWLMANINIGGTTLLLHCSNFLDPFARLIGLDGVILLAFILGFPANEIVIPIIIMCYMSTGMLTDFSNLNELRNLLVTNGWTYITAICFILFSLMHFPCSTTCLTIKKETGKWSMVGLSILIPTLTGIILCFLVSNFLKIIF